MSEFEIRAECAWKAVPIVAFGRSDLFPLQSNAQNYERRMPVGHLFATRCR
jgi:hypothetical protein